MFTGMAAMWGDHLYYKLFPVPHYLAKQSYLWTWATLVTPKMAGTIQGKPRETFTQGDWGNLFFLQQVLYYWRLVVILGFVGLSASSFMISYKTLLTTFLIDKSSYFWMTPLVETVIKFGLLPIPAL